VFVLKSSVVDLRVPQPNKVRATIKDSPVLPAHIAPSKHFATATGYINEYAATGLDEYFAESVRAYVEVNDPACAWLPVTRQDLYLRDPRMFALVDRLFRTEFRKTERRTTRRGIGVQLTNPRSDVCAIEGHPRD
jgi:hypothetical protein